MTNTNTSTQSPSPADGVPGPGDPRWHFAHATITARGVVAGVRPGQFELPTPCPDFDVRGLLGHMLTVFRRLAALGNGTDPMDMPDVVTDVTDDSWDDAFLTAAHGVMAAWTDASKLAQEMVLPWATAPGAAMVAMYSSELTVHTWDLAAATGQQPEWHAPTVEAALATALQSLPPADRESFFTEQAEAMGMPWLATHPPFRNAVAVADDAPALHRLLGWYGRQPIAA